MNAYIQYIMDIATQGEVCSDWLTHIHPTISHIMSRLAGCYGATALWFPTAMLLFVGAWMIQDAINHPKES